MDTTKTLLGSGNVFEISGTVRDQQGTQFPIRFAPRSSDLSVQAFFFSPDNAEMLIKTLDACDFNQRHWLFAAAATDLEFALTVRNRQTGQTEIFRNPAGKPASSINRTGLFVCGD